MCVYSAGRSQQCIHCITCISIELNVPRWLFIVFATPYCLSSLSALGLAAHSQANWGGRDCWIIRQAWKGDRM